jgi:hypothetical protein
MLAIEIASMAVATTRSNSSRVQGGDRYSFVWTDEVLHIQKAHSATAGKLSASLRSLVARIPASAGGWLVSVGSPKLKELVLWVESAETSFRVTITAAGTDADTSRAWVSDIVSGFKQAAAEGGRVVDDKWFEVSSAGLTTRLVAVIPQSFFERSR